MRDEVRGSKVLRRWLGAIVIAIAVLTAGASAAQAQYPPERPPALVISRESGPPGFPFTATVTDCVGGQLVVFVLGEQRVTATCDPVTLQASASFTAPGTVGVFTVYAELFGDCGPLLQGLRSGVVVAQADVPCLILSGTIEVLADGSGPIVTSPIVTSTTTATTTTAVPGGNLPSTGSNGVSSTLRTGLILSVVGLGFFVVGRVRRRTT